MKIFVVTLLVFLLLAVPAGANAVYYPAKGNGSGVYNSYSGITCTNQGWTSPCARYNESSLQVDMDRYSVKYQVKNNQGIWRWIQYTIPNPSNITPSVSSNPNALTWTNIYANNTSLRYIMTAHGIKLDIWGNGTPPSNYFNFSYSLSANVTFRMRGNEIEFMDVYTGEPLWLVQYPSMKINGTDVLLTFKKINTVISINAPELFTSGYDFSTGWELDPSTQSGGTIYISNRNNLTAIRDDIANATALTNTGTIWNLNANLINNNTGNRMYFNWSDVTDVRINSTNVSGVPTFWNYQTNGQTEIVGVNDTARVNFTCWNATTNNPEIYSGSARCAVYVSGAASKMNISWANFSYLGYNTVNYYGIYYSSSNNNTVSNSTFFNNYRGLYLSSANNNILINNNVQNSIEAGLYLGFASNNILINDTFMTNSTSTTTGDIMLSTNTANTNIFIGVNFSVSRKITYIVANNAYFNQSQDNGTSYLSTNTSVARTENRTIFNWTNTNISIRSVYTGTTQANFTVSGLCYPCNFSIYNNTNIDFNLTTNASGYLSMFSINYTTTMRNLSIIYVPESISGVPNITSWGNNKTNNATFLISINTSENLNFNTTANQSITTWTWAINGSNQSNNFDNITLSWGSAGSYNISVNGSNANGTTPTINWTVTVNTPSVSLYTPPTPINITSSQGNFWINQTVDNGTGNDSNGMNISWNANTSWSNGTNRFINHTLSAHASRETCFRAYNNSGAGTLNQTPICQNTTILNNVPSITVGNQNVNENDVVFIQLNATDADSDLLNYSINRTDLFTDFNTSTGKGNWTTNYTSAGAYWFNAGVQDNYSGITNFTFNITVLNIPAANITSWQSGKGNASTTITINRTEVLSLDFFANQTITTWNITKDGSETYNNSSNINLSWNTSGRRFVSVNGSNVNGITQILNFTIEVRSNILNRFDTIADSYTKGPPLWQNINYGNETLLPVNKKIYFNFSIFGYSSDQIANATFNYNNSCGNCASGYIYTINSSWNELLITYTNAPGLTLQQSPIDLSLGSIDMTQIVKGMMNGTYSNGIVLTVVEGDANIMSRENIAYNASYIQIHLKEGTFIPPSPINLTNTTGNFWVNYTWSAGAGNVTDSYNVSIINNSIQYWINGSAQNWANSTLSPGQWSNITIWAWNNSGTGTLSETGVSMSTKLILTIKTIVHGGIIG